MPDVFNILDQSLMFLTTNQLTTGEETLSRHLCGPNTVTLTSQTLRVGFFTARKTELITQVRAVSSSTAAGATPTLVRFGLYTIDSAGAGTLVASTANDTTLFASTNTAYTKALSASYTKQAGQRYGAAWLVVTGATAPLLMGSSFGVGSEAGRAPRIAGSWASQADLPASFADSDLGSLSGQVPYSVLLP